MSLYSGFPSRKLEEKYNGLIAETLELLTQIVISYVGRNKLEPFEKQLRRVVKSIEKMDGLKNLDPKYFISIKPLSNFLTEEEEERPHTFSEASRPQREKPERGRPLTSNNFIQEKRQSVEFERKTISVTNEPTRNNQIKYGKDDQRRIKYYSFSVKHTENGGSNSRKERESSHTMTMEELMESNRLVEKKMTLFRKKRHIQPNRISKIPELDEEEDSTEFS